MDMNALLLAIRSAIAQGLLWAVMTLGVYISYKVLDFADLSVDGTFALGGCVSAVMVINGANPLFALLVSMLAGCVGGFVTGFLSTKMKIPGILAGILTQMALYSINLRIMGRANTSLYKKNTLFQILSDSLPVGSIWLELSVGLIFCGIVVMLMYWFFGTEVGCALRATGINPNMSRAQGVNTDVMIIVGLMLSNGLVALSGGLVAQQQGYGDIGMGTGTIVTGLASIIIGSVLFRFLRGNFALKLLGAVLGSVVYRIIVAIVLQMGLNTDDLKLLSASIVALALILPLLYKKLLGVFPSLAKKAASRKEGK